jgi:t-SNARE complex subunit (syntaxin)
MNIINSALTEVRQATRDINDELDKHRQDILTLEKRLQILTNLRTSMEDAVDDLAAVNGDTVVGAIEIDADGDMDDTAAL